MKEKENRARKRVNGRAREREGNELVMKGVEQKDMERE